MGILQKTNYRLLKKPTVQNCMINTQRRAGLILLLVKIQLLQRPHAQHVSFNTLIIFLLLSFGIRSFWAFGLLVFGL